MPVYMLPLLTAKAKFGGTVALEQLAVSSEIELSEIGFNQIRGFAAEMWIWVWTYQPISCRKAF